MSIARKVTNSQTITTIPLNLRLETVDRAAWAFYKAPNQHIKNEMLQVIEDALPDSYARYTTPQGIVIERMDDQVEGPKVCLSVEQKAAGKLCPSCKLNLLAGEHGEVVDAYQGAKIIVCRHCGQFWAVRK